MKNRKVFQLSAFLFVFFTVLKAEPVKVIAIHYGNPDYEEVLSKDHYPGFEFYHTDGSEFMYTYGNSMFIGGLPSHLIGYYGEAPEKMGFSASYAQTKISASPFSYGVIYVVGSNGVIEMQTGPDEHFSEDLYPDEYSELFYELQKSLRKVKKNKLPKVLPVEKQVYFKNAPIGEREVTKTATVDKWGKGIEGWNVPDIIIYDVEEKAYQLPDVVNNESCFIVFYSMNAVKKVVGDRKTGIIEKEYYEEKPVNAARTAEGAVEQAQNVQSGEDLKNVFKTMLQATAENINSFYGQSVLVLDLVKKVNESVK